MPSFVSITAGRSSVDNEATVCLARIARAVHDHADRAWLAAFLDHWLPVPAAA